MWPLLSKPLYISMRRRKMYFWVYKVIGNQSIWGPCHFSFLSPNILWFFSYLFVWKHKAIIWKKSGKVKNLYGTCEGFSKKMKSTYGKMLNLTVKMKEIIWQKFGKVKNLYGNVQDLLKKTKWWISMEKWRIRLDKRKNLYGPTVF